MTDEPDRIRRYYLERERSGREKAYSLFDRAYLFTLQSLERDILSLLAERGLGGLSDSTILDVGCGTGAWLRRFVSYGAHPGRLVGLDLLPERVEQAQGEMPGVAFLCANAERLPFAPETFDIVLQFVTLSSIIDKQARRRAAREMLRVLRPGGVILSYDFIFNPFNPRTRGLPQGEYRRLFPGCSLHFHRVTLAPPFTRRVVRLSWMLCELVEKIVFLRSHYLTFITRSA